MRALRILYAPVRQRTAEAHLCGGSTARILHGKQKRGVVRQTVISNCERRCVQLPRVDRLFNQFWSDLPTRTAAGQSPSFQVNTPDDGRHIDVPLPGIDPQNVNFEVTGRTLTIRAEEHGDSKGQRALEYEQSCTIPQFLDLEEDHGSARRIRH
jgi:HSP20 family molecular chaperone IbpA